jgi:hypothetical protein
MQLSFAKGEPVFADDTVKTGFLDIHLISLRFKQAS